MEFVRENFHTDSAANAGAFDFEIRRWALGDPLRRSLRYPTGKGRTADGTKVDKLKQANEDGQGVDTQSSSAYAEQNRC